MLSKGLCQFLKGKKFSIVNNTSTRTASHLWTVDALLDVGLSPEFIFAPEHGWNQQFAAFEKVSEDSYQGVPVIALYQQGQDISHLIPSVDFLVFDLRTTGTRCFTYVSLLKQVMECCQKRGIALLIDSFPNLLPRRVSGPVVEADCLSHVSYIPTPFEYGLSLSELALFLYGKQSYSFPLDIFGLFDTVGHTDLACYYAPSPNLKSVASLNLYPATVFFEGTTLSEGRGTSFPFQLFGSPEFPVDSFLANVPQSLHSMVSFERVEFTPSSSKYSSIPCRGVHMSPFEPRIQPFDLAIHLFSYLFNDFRGTFQLAGLHNGVSFFDKLMGSTTISKLLTASVPPEEILRSLQVEHQTYGREVEKHVAETIKRERRQRGRVTLP